MKKLISSLSALLLLLAVTSCSDDSPYPGFKRMENGAYMKFYNQNKTGEQPLLHDEVTFEMSQYFNDSLLFTTVGNTPMSIVLTEPEFQGDVVDGLLMMHVGDSARMVVPADSVFTVMLQMTEIPEEYKGKFIYYDLKLLSLRRQAVLEAEHKHLLDSLRVVEENYLAELRNDPNNTVTESGIILLEQTGKGRLAQPGEFVNFDFSMCKPEGDTIMNSFGIEPVEIPYGEEFIGEGFKEIIGMVPVNGTLRCVIPSALAFDSTGYEQFILPYTPMVVRLQMNSVMDKATHDQYLAKIQADKEAEKNRLKALEPKAIADYIKAKGITVAPTESGLYIIPQEQHEGNKAQWGDEVKVHFIIKNLKEEVLESSYDYNEPMPFKVGSMEMIPAIDEAVMTMSKGDKVTLVSPSKLAFDAADMGAMLPPHSPLVIELELVDIK